MARTALGADRLRETQFTVVAPFATILRTLAPFTAERGSSHPIIDAVEASPAVVFERAVEIGADLGVSTVPPPARWSDRLLCEVGLSAHVPPDHPLGGRGEVEMSELVRHPLVLMDRTNAARTVFDDALAAERLEPASAIEMASSFMAQGVAATGRGAAILTNAAVFGLRPVRIMQRGKRVRMRLYAGWDPSHYAVRAIERWVDDFADWLPTIPDIGEVDDASA
ncbi:MULTISPECIES: LysR family transcriptional regulator substrate-binding protein [Microbacterium]|uniref:LysR family transcriptional regulator substrate-binding protein n=1 Tax=Microbacterium TaxID=33882 RepID=UPI00217D93E7|nr:MULTISPECIES: LysR family transcriptional regulator substrate-binding protein [Microbacterium]UWF76975.1 LysR family transcriptional regulator substrate-binding protein [Microbacterium neungamense]WCM55135.1 LysR family transcriptional regulator substrate-binding protein [Microbacterium sp. EF45047]